MCLGIPGRILSIRDDAGLTMGVVDFGGVRRDVCLQYVAGEAAVGDYVIVHVGFAISRLDEEEAHRTFEILREMNRLDELDAMSDTGGAPSQVVRSAGELL
jgi:hydrogenase expression/formation protein HypC